MALRIQIDHDGYPTDESVERLKACQDVAEAMQAVAEYLVACGYGSARKRGKLWRFATGGWSGCEQVINSLSLFVYACSWRKSFRGGAHWFQESP